MSIRILIHGQLKEASAADFTDLAERASVGAGEEPGTTEYLWFVDDAGRTVVAETYVDEAAFGEHVARANASGILPEFNEMVAIESFQVFGEVSDELRANLADWRPTFYSLVGGV